MSGRTRPILIRDDAGRLLVISPIDSHTVAIYSETDELPAKARAEIERERSDIEFIHFDDGYFNGPDWVIPCEAVIDGAWMHGHMIVELIEGDAFDYSVGDWQPGMHPDLHTFER